MSKYSKYLEAIDFESGSLIEEMEMIELKIQADRGINVIKIGGSKMTEEEDKEAIEQMQAILKKHDIEMSVKTSDHCAWIEFKYKGVWVVDAWANFDMFEGEGSQ